MKVKCTIRENKGILKCACEAKSTDLMVESIVFDPVLRISVHSGGELTNLYSLHGYFTDLLHDKKLVDIDIPDYEIEETRFRVESVERVHDRAQRNLLVDVKATLKKVTGKIKKKSP